MKEAQDLGLGRTGAGSTGNAFGVGNIKDSVARVLPGAIGSERQLLTGVVILNPS
jgi:hypothetical protein